MFRETLDVIRSQIACVHQCTSKELTRQGITVLAPSAVCCAASMLAS